MQMQSFTIFSQVIMASTSSLRCDICDVTVTDQTCMAAHLAGQKHKKKLNDQKQDAMLTRVTNIKIKPKHPISAKKQKDAHAHPLRSYSWCPGCNLFTSIEMGHALLLPGLYDCRCSPVLLHTSFVFFCQNGRF